MHKEEYINSLVSIGIVNWNSTKYLNISLESIFKQTYKNIEIIIVDNNSQDGFKEWVKEKNFDNNIKIIYNKANLGFSKAQNQAIKASSGEYYLCLNPDVILKENFVEEMVNTLKKDEKIGSASGKLLRIPPELFEKIYDNNRLDESLFRKLINTDKNETCWGHIIDSTGHVIQKNRIGYSRDEEKLDYGNFNIMEEVFGVSGAAAIYKKEMLEDIKIFDEYFDEDFSTYYEDLDLDWRAQLRGWKCIYTPYAIAYHIRGGVIKKFFTKRRNIFRKRGSVHNRHLMMLKNDNIKYILKDLWIILLTEFYLLHAHPIGYPLSVLSYMPKLPNILKKRKIIQQSKKVANIDKIYKYFVYPKNINKLIYGFLLKSAFYMIVIYMIIKIL